MILEYKLHMTAGGLKAPEWVEDGGHWWKSSDKTFIGWSPDEADREYYVPDTVTTLTAEELRTRVLAMHSAAPFKKPSNEPGQDLVQMTDEEVTAQVNAWLSTHSG